jgi:acyl-CoA thioesterase
MIFTELMAMAASGSTVEVPPQWMQGRTLSGGVATALCHAAVVARYSLPPLRSASVSFIAPSSGQVKINTEILRQGKSVVCVQADLISGDSLATRIMFAFGTGRESRLDQTYLAKPEWASSRPDEFKAANSEDFGVATFTQYFDIRPIQGGIPCQGHGGHDNWVWLRHRDSAATDVSALLMIADALPPAVLPGLPPATPASSLSWLANIVSEQPSTEDGWWLLRCLADQAQSGYSSQNMMVWNRSGELVATGRQATVVFG